MESKIQENNLLLEAAEWRLISLLFECPVGDWQVQVKELAEEVKDSNLKKAADLAASEAAEGIYHSIFGPGGPAPPREVTYRSWTQPGYLLSELSTYYQVFGFTPETRETPDHISVETAFLAYLKLKEAFANECGDVDKCEITSQAAKHFVEGHLSKFVEQITKSLSFSGVEYLALTSAALFQRVGKDKDKKVRQILPVLDLTEEEIFECSEI